MADGHDDHKSALVFGARNLGGAIISDLIDHGWAVAGAARSEETLRKVTTAGALALRADVTDQASVQDALAQAATANGQVDLVVNAASASAARRSGPFGGGQLAEADDAAFDSWASAPPRAAFTFLSGAARFLLDQQRPATVIQVTGGSALRAKAGRGLWAAGAFGVRALTQAAALELRAHSIHVVLLIVDAGIERAITPTPSSERQSMADPRQIAEATRFLADQGSRAATHELQVTPLAETWTP